MRTAGGSGTPYAPQWGPWSDVASGSTAACVPTNEFPPLDSPTAEAAADGGSIDVAFRLPSAEFEYLLTLYRSADGKSYSPHLTPVELDYGDASPHTFDGLVPSAGGWYQARLKACRDDDRTDCGEPAYSNIVTLPEPTTNRPPAFDRTSYSFTAAPSATVGTSVGTAAATDEDGTVASYSLDDASRFAISSSGEISVGASLTGLAGTSVTLTVTATDDDGATASVEIEIRVTAGSLPPADAPGSLVLNHPGDTFIVVEWHASAHAAEYAIEMLRSGAWERTEGITDEYHVFEHLSPGTEYRFRVQAKGDGVNRNAEEWSAWSQTLVTSTTGTAPNSPPTFDQTSYDLNVRIDAPSGHAVGTVSATDPGPDDELRYRISGTTYFEIDANSGEITTSGLLLTLTSTSYDMTVYVSDSVNPEVSVPVTVTLDPSPITLTMNGLDAEIDIGEVDVFAVVAENLVPGTSYVMEASTNAVGQVGFDTCMSSNKLKPFEPLAAEKTISFSLRGCDGVLHANVFAKLKLSGNEVATTTGTHSVRPAPPTNLRGIGFSPSSTNGKATVRFDTTASTTYIARYKRCEQTDDYCVTSRPSTWDGTTSTKTATSKTFSHDGTTVTAHEISLEGLTINLESDAIYRIEVATLLGGAGGVTGPYSEPAFVYTAHELPDRIADVTDPSGYVPPRIGSVPIKAYWTTPEYTATICDDTFNPLPGGADKVANGISTWHNALKWIYEDGTEDKNIVEVSVIRRNSCSTHNTNLSGDEDYPGRMHVRMAVNMNEFRSQCGADGQNQRTKACVPRRSGATAPDLPVTTKAPMFFRPKVMNFPDWGNLDNATCAKVYRTAIHEAGHALGLGHSAKPELSVMYRSGTDRYCVPQTVDVTAVIGLYQYQ